MSAPVQHCPCLHTYLRSSEFVTNEISDCFYTREVLTRIQCASKSRRSSKSKHREWVHQDEYGKNMQERQEWLTKQIQQKLQINPVKLHAQSGFGVFAQKCNYGTTCRGRGKNSMFGIEEINFTDEKGGGEMYNMIGKDIKQQDGTNSKSESELENSINHAIHDVKANNGKEWIQNATLNRIASILYEIRPKSGVGREKDGKDDLKPPQSQDQSKNRELLTNEMLKKYESKLNMPSTTENVKPYLAPEQSPDPSSESKASLKPNSTLEPEENNQTSTLTLPRQPASQIEKPKETKTQILKKKLTYGLVKKKEETPNDRMNVKESYAVGKQNGNKAAKQKQSSGNTDCCANGSKRGRTGRTPGRGARGSRSGGRGGQARDRGNDKNPGFFQSLFFGRKDKKKQSKRNNRYGRDEDDDEDDERTSSRSKSRGRPMSYRAPVYNNNKQDFRGESYGAPRLSTWQLGSGAWKSRETPSSMQETGSSVRSSRTTANNRNLPSNRARLRWGFIAMKPEKTNRFPKGDGDKDAVDLVSMRTDSTIPPTGRIYDHPPPIPLKECKGWGCDDDTDSDPEGLI